MGRPHLWANFFLAALLLFGLGAPALPVQAAQYAPPAEPLSQSAFLVNLDSEMLIYEKNKDLPLEPGDLTMLMTAIIAWEMVPDLEGTTTTMKAYVQDQMYTENVSRGGILLAGLIKDEEISIKNLLYASLMRGANEAATMIADYVGDGSVSYFVELMNQKAAQIGAVNTHFTTPHGLPGQGNVSTAYDMYLITRYAMQLPGFMDIVGTTFYDGGPTNKHDSLQWATTNRMIVSTSPSYYSPVQGIKAAFADDYNHMISLAQQDGYTYLLVLMGAPTADASGNAYADNLSFTETRNLYEWAFDTFQVKTLLEKGHSFGEVPLRLAWGKDHVKLMGGERFSALIPEEIEVSSVQYELVLPDYVRAPVEQGEPIGYVRLKLAGEEIGMVTLCAAETVEVNRLLLLMDKVRTLLDSYWFKFLLVFLVLLVAFYTWLTVARNRGRARYKRVRHKKPL